MRTHRNVRAITSAFLIVLCHASSAFACICCAEPGEWKLYEQAPSEFERNEVSSLQFGEAFTTSMDEQGILRLDENAKALADVYRVVAERDSAQWKLTFTDERNEGGTLALQVPEAWTFYHVDFGEKLARQFGPLLYKEVRFEGSLQGTGIFASDVTQHTHFRMVLQGRGNKCFNASDFTSWILRIEGPDPRHPESSTVYYYFHGSFKDGNRMALK